MSNSESLPGTEGLPRIIYKVFSCRRLPFDNLRKDGKMSTVPGHRLKFADASDELFHFLSKPMFDVRTLALQDNTVPRVSVIMPSYNQATYIERSILSVLNQNYPNLEFIIIDGGSTDGSVDIIRKYEEYLYYWVSEKDRGQTHAINKGLKVATGELMGFQNSDDIYMPKAFEQIAEAYAKHPSAGVIYGDFFHVDERDNILDEQVLIKACCWIQVFHGPQIHNQAAFWKRWVYEKVGPLNESLRFDMDYEYFCRILCYAIPTVHLKLHIGGFRHHDKTKTSTLKHISKKELKEVSEYYRRKESLFKVLPRGVMKPLSVTFKALCHIYAGRIDYVLRERHKYK